MKNIIPRQILLRYPDFTKPFMVYTDTSDYQLGGIIIKKNIPVAFYSRKLNSTQQNYTTMEKKLLYVVVTAGYHSNIILSFKTYFHSNHKHISFENFMSERVRRW